MIFEESKSAVEMGKKKEKKGIIPRNALFRLDQNGSIGEAQTTSTPVIVAVVILGIIIFSVNPYGEWKVRRRLRARPIVPPEDWIATLPSCSGQQRTALALQILDIIAKRLKISPGQLRPNDSIVTDLSYHGIWRQFTVDDWTDEVVWSLEQLFEREKIRGVSFENCLTLSALLGEICRHVPDPE